MGTYQPIGEYDFSDEKLKFLRHQTAKDGRIEKFYGRFCSFVRLDPYTVKYRNIFSCTAIIVSSIF